MESIENSCCFTGHRIIRTEHRDKLNENLCLIIEDLYNTGVYRFLCGGALGFDTVAAKAVISMKSKFPAIKLILALPCHEQEKSWSKSSIIEYEAIKSSADEVIYISDKYYDGCMQKRNRFMVDNSTHCVFYLTSVRGGTGYTVKYALEKERKMHNIITLV